MDAVLEADGDVRYFDLLWVRSDGEGGKRGGRVANHDEIGRLEGLCWIGIDCETCEVYSS